MTLPALTSAAEEASTRLEGRAEPDAGPDELLSQLEHEQILREARGQGRGHRFLSGQQCFDVRSELLGQGTGLGVVDVSPAARPGRSSGG